jgi:hypothetical protein
VTNNSHPLYDSGADPIQLQDSIATNWESHIDGLQRVVAMRGGFKNLIKQSPHLTPTLVIYIL